MASVSFYNASMHRRMTLTVTEQSYSVETNTSVVSWEILIERTDSTAAAATYTHAKAVINNVTVCDVTMSNTYTDQAPYFPIRVDYTTNKVSQSGTITVAHDDDGTKTVAFTLSGWFYTAPDTDVSDVLTLTDIQRFQCVKVKVGGSWKKAYVFIKAGGVWKKARKIWANVNNAWKESAIKG